MQIAFEQRKVEQRKFLLFFIVVASIYLSSHFRCIRELFKHDENEATSSCSWKLSWNFTTVAQFIILQH